MEKNPAFFLETFRRNIFYQDISVLLKILNSKENLNSQMRGWKQRKMLGNGNKFCWTFVVR